MEKLLIIDKATNKVLNCIVPPSGSDAYFLPENVYGIQNSDGKIGDTYNPVTQEFLTEIESEVSEYQKASEDARTKKQANLEKIQKAIDELTAKGDLCVQDQATLAILENSLDSMK